MLSDAIVLETRRLLDENQLTWREIADRLGVSRSFVGNVSRGRRILRTMPIEEAQEALATRCRHCGGLVYKPCLLCRSRAYRLALQRDGKIRGSRRASGPRSRRVA